MYSCINEIMTHVTSPPERGNASKPDAGGGLTTQGRERIGALECVARLARGGHGAAMSGSAGGFVAAVAKLLKSTDGTSASSGKTFPNAWALTEDGARSLRRCAIRSLAAVVGVGAVASGQGRGSSCVGTAVGGGRWRVAGGWGVAGGEGGVTG